MSKTDQPAPISWTIDRFANGQAVLTNDQHQLLVPRGQLPENIKEGDVVTAEFYLLKNEKKRKENIARALLEEILGEE
jgi:hypothetical protein